MSHIPIDEQLLDHLSSQTGRSKELFLAQAAKLVDAHFRSLLEVLDTDTTQVMDIAKAVMDDYAEAFHELAR